MSDQSTDSHAVIVAFDFAGEDTAPLDALGARLATLLRDSPLGRYDGHETALLEGTDAYLFLYGPDADRLFDAVRPVLDSSPLLQGASATLRYGSPDDLGAGERLVRLGRAA